MCGHFDFESGLKAGLHVRRKHKHKHKQKPRVNRDDASTSARKRNALRLFLRLCVCRPGSHVAYACACACVVRVNQPLLHKMTDSAEAFKCSRLLKIRPWTRNSDLDDIVHEDVFAFEMKCSLDRVAGLFLSMRIVTKRETCANQENGHAPNHSSLFV